MWKDKPLQQLTYKNILIIITYTILLILCVVKWDMLLSVLRMIISLLMPFLLAFLFAFIFQIPMHFFMRKLPKGWGGKRKGIAAGLSLLCIVAVLTFVFWIVVPQLVESVSTLVKEFPEYVRSSEAVISSWLEEWGMGEELIEQIDKYSVEIENAVVSLAKDMLPRIISMTGSVLSTLTNFVMAMVIAVYFICSKEKLVAQAHRTLHAFLPKDKYERLVYIGRLSGKTFTSFFSGQLVEAIIIGILCYIGASILRLDYAPILAVVIGCTNIIPIFGPIIGTGICAILLVFISPIQAVIFIVFGILLQQFESNLIYPHVVGNSVGLSGLWVLLAVSVGGGLFGLTGMIFGLPVFAILYRLFAEEVNRRNMLKKQKGESCETIRE